MAASGNQRQRAASSGSAGRQLPLFAAPGIAEVIERYNADLQAGSHLFLGTVTIEGERQRCRLCGEPIVLDDEDDPDSWVHAEDANDGADHTAEPGVLGQAD